tara:strand:- start:920 stop:1099 length:180 start_codon:yes stop_codon:yes gene_type:complete
MLEPRELRLNCRGDLERRECRTRRTRRECLERFGISNLFFKNLFLYKKKFTQVHSVIVK